jgi:DNA-directed RNA polymerase subunit K/omega
MLVRKNDLRVASVLDVPADRVLPASESVAPASLIASRFLFVFVTAKRAWQLRRGARQRLDPERRARLEPSTTERVAMEEVRDGLVQYDLPLRGSGSGRHVALRGIRREIVHRLFTGPDQSGARLSRTTRRATGGSAH